MANIERPDYSKVELSSNNPFALTLKDGGKEKRLFIEEPRVFGSGTTKDAQSLLRTVMVGHMVAANFPKTIETNFTVDNTLFLDELYKHYGFKSPRIMKSADQIVPSVVPLSQDNHQKMSIASAHSGGLDSIYRVIKFLAENKKVLTVHLQNLNPKGNSREAFASQKQAKVLKLPFENIKLRNNSGNTGFNAMRTRDMLLGLMVAVSAEKYGVSKVLVEGGMQNGADSHFSEYEPAWEFFNKLIKEVGMNLQVEGIDPGDVETIGEIIKLEKKLNINVIPLVQNCFSAPYQALNSRQRWEREVPVLFKKSPEHWCGSCLKCRRMTLGRLYYNDPRFKKIPISEVRHFVKDTYIWMKKFPHNRDLISSSFLNHLDTLESQRV